MYATYPMLSPVSGNRSGTWSQVKRNRDASEARFCLSDLRWDFELLELGTSSELEGYSAHDYLP